MLMNHLSSIFEPDVKAADTNQLNIRFLNATPVPTIKKNSLSIASSHSRNEYNRKLSSLSKSKTNKNVLVPIPKLQLNKLNVQNSNNYNSSANNLQEKTIDENEELNYKAKKEDKSALNDLQDLKIPPISKKVKNHNFKRRNSRILLNLKNRLVKFGEQANASTSLKNLGIKEENAFDGISKTQTFSLLKSYNQSIIENIHHADSINSVVPKAKMRHSGSKHKIDYD